MAGVDGLAFVAARLRTGNPPPSQLDFVAAAAADYGFEWEGRRWACAQHVLTEYRAHAHAANPNVQHGQGSVMAVARRLGEAAKRGELDRVRSDGMWWYSVPEAS